jgi:3-isopropylmalate/(R)-2-methylmalate dehydratase small subunit
LVVDLEKQSIVRPDGSTIAFDIEASRKHILLNGLDDIGLTMQHADAIRDFEQKWQQRSPWLFA